MDGVAEREEREGNMTCNTVDGSKPWIGGKGVKSRRSKIDLSYSDLTDLKDLRQKAASTTGYRFNMHGEIAVCRDNFNSTYMAFLTPDRT